MGAQGSKDKEDKLNETKVNIENISTVTMALDNNGKPRSKASAADNGAGQVYPMQKYPPPLNSSSVRFSPLSNRAMDLNGNHFYPNSLGRGSVNSKTNAEDPNNNIVYTDKDTLSKASKVDLEKASHRSNTPTIGHEHTIPSNAPNQSQYSISRSVIVSKEASKETKMPKENGRKSSSTVLVFLIELLSIIGLAAFAYVLHYTNTFYVVKREYRCDDKTIQFSRNPLYYDDIYLANASANAFYLIFLLAPLGVIVVLEIFRQLILIGLAHTVPNETVAQKKLAIAFPIYIRRIVRFVGGFLIGGLMTSILVDILKHQTGHLRPYFLNTCTNLTHSSCTNNLTEFEGQCGADLKDDLKIARMSFPSMTAGMSSYAAIFLVLYLSFAFPYRALRFLRVWMILAISVVTVLVFNARLSTNQSHVADMVVGLFIGFFIGLFIVFIHLNAFANRLSNSNFLGANRTKDRISSVEGQTENGDLFDEVSHSNLFADNDKDWFWKNFHIPRVHTLRQSARNMWRKSENYFSRPSADSVTNTPNLNHKLSNAYINPAFNGREENILANHIHQESRFGTRENNNNNNNNSNSNQQRNTLRTFQANS